jgi:hypothetical protein
MYNQVMWAAFHDELVKIALQEKEAGKVWDFLKQEIPGTPTLLMGRGEQAAEKARAALRASKGGGRVLRFNPNAGMFPGGSREAMQAAGRAARARAAAVQPLQVAFGGAR